MEVREELGGEYDRVSTLAALKTVSNSVGARLSEFTMRIETTV